MSITDELRNWMENAFTYKTVDGDMFHKVNTPWFGWKRDIEEMLDRIDAELAERYVALPVDADDVPIRIGDKMVFLDFYGNKSEPFVVEGFESPDMWLVHCDEGRVRYTANPMHTRHYHESTVEDVLKEFANKVCNSGHQWGLDATDTIAEYAAKLCLKEDE